MHPPPPKKNFIDPFFTTIIKPPLLRAPPLPPTDRFKKAIECSVPTHGLSVGDLKGRENEICMQFCMHNMRNSPLTPYHRLGLVPCGLWCIFIACIFYNRRRERLVT